MTPRIISIQGHKRLIFSNVHGEDISLPLAGTVKIKKIDKLYETGDSDDPAYYPLTPEESEEINKLLFSDDNRQTRTQYHYK